MNELIQAVFSIMGSIVFISTIASFIVTLTIYLTIWNGVKEDKSSAIMSITTKFVRFLFKGIRRVMIAFYAIITLLLSFGTSAIMTKFAGNSGVVGIGNLIGSALAALVFHIGFYMPYMRKQGGQ